MGSGSSTGRLAPEGSFRPADAESKATSSPTLLTNKKARVDRELKLLIEKQEENNALARQKISEQAIIVEHRRRRLSVAPLSNCEQEGQVGASPVQTKRASATRRRLSVVQEPALDDGLGSNNCVDEDQDGEPPFQTMRTSISRGRLSVVSSVGSCEDDDGQVDASPAQTKRTSTTRRRLSVISSFGICDVGGQVGASPVQTKRASTTRRRLSVVSNFSKCEDNAQVGVSPVQTKRASTTRRRLSIPGFVSPRVSNGFASSVDGASTTDRRSSTHKEVSYQRRSRLVHVLSQRELDELDSESDSLSDFGAESDGCLEFGRDSEDSDNLRELKCRYAMRRHSGVDVEGLPQDHYSPMPVLHAIPIKTFMQLTKLKSFKELQEEGMLVEVAAGTPITFVAMQWLSKSHPDPSGKQLRMLQAALNNLHGGSATLAGDLRRQNIVYTMDELVDMAESYIWIGYCCRPHEEQDVLGSDDTAAFLRSCEGFSALADAVDSSKYFLALAPAIHHAGDEEANLDFATFRESGWLRLAFAARALSLGDTRLLLVEGAHNLRTVCSQDHLWTPTASGTFGSESDLVAASEVLETLIERKHDAYLAAGCVEDYRLLKATRSLLLKGAGDDEYDDTSDESCSDCGEEQDLKSIEKGAHAANSAQCASKLRLVSKTAQARAWDFLRSFGLVSAQQPDAMNCTAMHYAAVCGSPKVLKALASIGSGMEVLAEGYPEGNACMGHWPELKGMTALHFAALLGQNPLNIHCLIELGAQIDARDARQRTPLMLCCYADNVEVARRLIDLRADPGLQDELGCTALHHAAAHGRSQLCELLLSQGAPVSNSLLGSSPLFELALCSPTPGLVDMLVRGGCTVDEVSEIKTERTLVRKWLETKPVTSHHMLDCLVGAHSSMTALMAASMAGNGKVVKALVEAGALG